MFSVFQSLGSLPKTKKCKIDGAIFQLHYLVTMLTLIIFFAILTTRQFVGDPCMCVFHQDKISQTSMDVWCWTHTTYTAPFTKNNTKTGHPGVGGTDEPNTFRYHTYYQWVAFVLLIQAGAFYVPRWLWLEWEGGKVEHLMEGLRVAALDKEEKQEKVDVVLDYIRITWAQHDWYAKKYLICQGIAIANIVLQYIFLNIFFEDNFITLGVRELAFQYHPRGVAPLYQLFPLVTMCKFQLYGETGETMVVPAICIMPLNIVNKKIYYYLWFWFLVLLVLSILNLAFDITVHVMPKWRTYILRHTFQFLPREVVHKLVEKGGAGDCLLLYLLGRNIDFVVFKEVMEGLYEHLKDAEESNEDVRERALRKEPGEKSNSGSGILRERKSSTLPS